MSEKELNKSLQHKNARRIVHDSVQHSDARAKLDNYSIQHQNARANIAQNSQNQTNQSSSLPPRSSRDKK